MKTAIMYHLGLKSTQNIPSSEIGFGDKYRKWPNKRPLPDKRLLTNRRPLHTLSKLC